MSLREAAQQALEALELEIKGYADKHRRLYPVAHALRTALAEPEQGPVAWTLTETLEKRETTTTGYLWFSNPQNSCWTPLYTRPVDDIALLRQALEALEVLETYMPYYLRDRKRPLITALRERLGEKT